MSAPDETPAGARLYQTIVDAGIDPTFAAPLMAALAAHADLVDEWVATQRDGAYLSFPAGTTEHDAGLLCYDLLHQWGLVGASAPTEGGGVLFVATVPPPADAEGPTGR